MGDTVAFVPARGGSKRIHGKNLQRVGGLTLVERAAWAALGAGMDAVVSTDDAGIGAIAARCATLDLTGPRPPGAVGTVRNVVRVHERPAPLASDTAQIEAAIDHWLRRCDEKPDVIVLLQPTSPLRTAQHVREAVALRERVGADSVVSVTVGHEHHFAGRLKPRDQGDGADEWSWYEWAPFRDVTQERPRTQDLRPVGHENGAVYVFTTEHFVRTGCRMGGKMAAYPMDRWASIDVDTPEDLEVARLLAGRG